MMKQAITVLLALITVQALAQTTGKIIGGSPVIPKKDTSIAVTVDYNLGASVGLSKLERLYRKVTISLAGIGNKRILTLPDGEPEMTDVEVIVVAAEDTIQVQATANDGIIESFRKVPPGKTGIYRCVITGALYQWRGSFADVVSSGGGSLQTTTNAGDSTNLRIKVVKSNSRFIVSDSIAWYKRFISTTGLEGVVLENIRTEKYGNVYTSPYNATTYRMGEWNRFLTRNWYNPGSNRPGEVLTMDSYNASRSGGRLFTDEASWANVFESHYEQNRDQFEYYQQVILRDGYSYRPFSMYIGKKDSTNDTRFQSHIFHVTPVGIEADMLNLKNGSLQIARQPGATPATPGQTWTEFVMAESTGSGNTFTISNTGSGGVTFTQTATNATFNFNKTILGGTNVNIGASGGAMGKAFLTELRITTRPLSPLTRNLR